MVIKSVNWAMHHRKGHCKKTEKIWTPDACQVSPEGEPGKRRTSTSKAARREAPGPEVPCVDVVRLKRTNRRVKGLSLNRSQKRSALLSTTPRLRTRSSTNDLAPLRRMWLVSLRLAGAFVGARQQPSYCGSATGRAEIGRRPYIVASRRKRR